MKITGVVPVRFWTTEATLQHLLGFRAALGLHEVAHRRPMLEFGGFDDIEQGHSAARTHRPTAGPAQRLAQFRGVIDHAQEGARQGFVRGP